MKNTQNKLFKLFLAVTLLIGLLITTAAYAGDMVVNAQEPAVAALNDSPETVPEEDSLETVPAASPEEPPAEEDKTALSVTYALYKADSLGDIEVYKANKTGEAETPETLLNPTEVLNVQHVFVDASVNVLKESPCKNAEVIDMSQATNLQNIAPSVCKGNTQLQIVIFPAGISTIGNQAFEGCSALSVIDLNAATALTEIGEYAFSGTGANTVLLPAVTTDPVGLKIRKNAFAMTGMAEIRIPAGVSRIEEDVLFDCANLRGILFESTTPPEMPYAIMNGIAGSPSFSYIIVPDSAAEAYRTVPGLTGLGGMIASTTVTIADEGNIGWTKGSPNYLIVKADALFNKFQEVSVDGRVLTESEYIAESGSTIIKLKPEYLNTLPVGKHTLTMKWSYASKTTTFEVKAAAGSGVNPAAGGEKTTTSGTNSVVRKSPNTGDTGNLLILIMFLSAGVFGVYEIKRRMA